MSKFDILDECNFGMPYLFHLKFFFTNTIGLDSYSNLVFVIKISAQSKML